MHWQLLQYIGRTELTLALCLSGHFIYECKGSRPYISRPSRTQQLENPKILAKLKADGKPSVEVPEEFKSKCVSVSGCLLRVCNSETRSGTANRILEEKEKERLKIQDKGEGSSHKRRRYVLHFGLVPYHAYVDVDMSLSARGPHRLRQAQIATAIPTLTLGAPPTPHRNLIPTTRAALAARAREGSGTVVKAVAEAVAPDGDGYN